MSGRQLIRMRGIVKRFYVGQPNELEILHGIDLDVNEGEFVRLRQIDAYEHDRRS